MLLSPSKFIRIVPIFAGLFGFSGISDAQVAVSGVTYGSSIDGSNRTISKLTYSNIDYPVTSVATGVGDYQFTGPTASAVSFRRNTGVGNDNNSTVFQQYTSYSGSSSDGTSATVLARSDNSPTLSEVMLSSDLTQGLRNPFSNTGGSSGTDTNIERIDFRLANYVVQAGDSMVFFDLENSGNFGDGFRIAAYTAVGTVNGQSSAPTTYANTGLLVAADSFGTAVTAPGGGNATYLRSTTTDGDDLDHDQTIAKVDSNSGSGSELYLVGIMIRFSDLGIAVGTTIQGFSLMAGDVVPTNAASLVDWNSSSVYLTDTNAGTYGNMDFMGFGAQIARPIPEPSTYGAILMGAFGAVVGLRRKGAALRAWLKRA